MHDDSIHPDPFAQTAYAALRIAVKSARKIEGDKLLAQWANDLEQLPDWRTANRRWLVELGAFLEPHRLPNEQALAERSPAQYCLLRVCFDARDAATRSDPPGQHRHLLQAGLFAGVLMRLAREEGDIDAQVAAAMSANGTKATKARKSVQAMDQARELFNEWKAGKHTFRSNTAFAKWACDIVRLTSDTSVQNLARRVGVWERERLASRSKT